MSRNVSGIGSGGWNRLKTKCIRGHDLSGVNVRVTISGGGKGYKCRQCKLCQRYRVRRAKKIVVKAYGGKCVWKGCKIKDLDMLVIDHVDNDGRFDRKKNLSGSKLHLSLIRRKFPPEYQILCANHNLKKELTRRRE
jgi:hypothetical protein